MHLQIGQPTRGYSVLVAHCLRRKKPVGIAQESRFAELPKTAGLKPRKEGAVSLFGGKTLPTSLVYAAQHFVTYVTLLQPTHCHKLNGSLNKKSNE